MKPKTATLHRNLATSGRGEPWKQPHRILPIDRTQLGLAKADLGQALDDV
jgi:hypothetical protein